jgi:Flp pilus assembly pilin Flp
MINKVVKFFGEEEGATMVEYALMVLLVAVALILTVTALKDGIAKPLGDATTELTK